MAIVRLPRPTATLLSLTHIHPTYEATISVTLRALLPTSTSATIHVSPCALRFSIATDGTLPSPFEHALLPAGEKALAALAALASVELRYRTRLRLVRAGRVLDDRRCDAVHGVRVAVWELFCATPVRRRVEAARDAAELISAVREHVTRVALTNPSKRISLVGDNGVVLYETSGLLSVDAIQAAWGVQTSWEEVSAVHSLLRLHGFVSKTGSGTERMMVAGLDGADAPLLVACVRKAWRVYVGRGGRGMKRYPAFVLNIITQDGCAEREGLVERHESFLYNAISSALMRDTKRQRERGMHRTIELPTRKRRRSCLERFCDAFISKRRKPSASIWSSEHTVPRPLSRRLPHSECPRPFSRARAPVRTASRDVEAAYRSHLPDWKNPCLPARPKTVGAASERFNKKGVSITREALRNVKIVGQVDCKFIVVSDESGVYAVDQHAASERFMFESLLRRTVKTIRAADVHNPRPITLSHLQRSLALRERDALASWGWTLSFVEDNVSIVQAPRLEPINVILVGAEHLKEFLDSMLEGARAQDIPRPVLEAVASAACHKAVRFGDVLSRAQCESIVRSLVECDSPFCCAHGRPNIVPMVAFAGCSGFRLAD